MKKIISIVLIFVLILSLFSFNISALTDKDNEYPVILVLGRGANTPYYSDDGKQIFPEKFSEEFIKSAVKECAPAFLHGIATGDEKPLAKKVSEVIAPVYEELIPDRETGEVKGGPKLINKKGYPLTPGSNAYDYIFNYDWRLDPCDTADYLDEYIAQIKEATNSPRVSLVGRCYGANVVSAYLYEYGHSDIDTVVYYCSTALGCYATSCLFSGKIAVSPTVLESFLENNELINDKFLNEFIRALVSFMNSYYGLNLTTDIVNKIIADNFSVFAPEIFPVCYGSMSCFWDMVDNDCYEEAKKLIFNGIEDEYASLIKKTDHYHYDIMAKLPEMLGDYQSEGLNVGIIAKYGVDAQYPVYDNGSPQSDNTVEIYRSAFYAVSSKYGETLSQEYLKDKDEKYISPDLCIDMSPSYFRDCTWIINGIEHSLFPDSIDGLITAICNFDGQMTVTDKTEYPQFLKYNENNKSISPMEKVTVEKENFIISFFRKLLRLIKSQIELIKSWMAK